MREGGRDGREGRDREGRDRAKGGGREGSVRVKGVRGRREGSEKRVLLKGCSLLVIINWCDYY